MSILNLFDNTKKKVIDGDSQRIVDRFDEKDTKQTLEYYESLGKWSDVSVDRDGDIILWKD